MHKLNDHLEGKGKQLDKEGLPVVNFKDVDSYINYYENLIRKRTKASVEKVRSLCMQKIAKKHKSSMGKKRSADLELHKQEVKAFYEGDIVKMDRAQKHLKSSKKPVKWYEWDMVMIFPNPDYKADREEVDGYLLDSPEQAVNRYKNCFREIYNENQVEMKKERKVELELVKEIAETHLYRDGKVINICGGRFKRHRNTELYDEVEEASYGEDYEGGYEDEKVKEEDEVADIADEDAHAQAVKEMSINDIEEETDPFIDTRVY